jgi:solute carrier family 13 (sodium-dependent dicarboxylate transporter), member 2/3/5
VLHSIMKKLVKGATEQISYSSELPARPSFIRLATPKKKGEGKRWIFILLGFGLFLLFYFLPPLPNAVDPLGKEFVLSQEAKAGIGLFLMAAIWWVFEVVPIGVTSIMIGVMQALFFIRTPKEAFKDFMDPSVMFIFGSILIGMAFAKSGLARRMAYKMLCIVGERTSMIMLGTFLICIVLSHFMAHTAVAATVFPIMMAIHSLYDEENRPTKFGKGLFIGMAYVCGAGSICTYLGSARAAVGAGIFQEVTGRSISFGELSYYLIPMGWLVGLLLWLLMLVFFKPEQRRIPGLREKAIKLYSELGKMGIKEKMVILATTVVVSIMVAQSFIPSLQGLNRAAIVLTMGILFFLFDIFKKDDLESVSWNIILLFGGAMSIGFCLWQTGAADWMAVQWLSMFQDTHWLVFVMIVAVLVLLLTNFIMNVAAISITLPVSLVIAEYLKISPELIVFVSLTTAGFPFLTLIGAAPNAIAYESKQFTTGNFFVTGIPASIMLLLVLLVFILIIWPMMGMPILIE